MANKVEPKLKIYTFLDDVAKAYKAPVSRVEGLTRNPKDIIRTIEFYSNDKYTSGDHDELEREKPFYNVGNYRVTVAKTATDLDVKDIKYEPDSLKYSVQAMLINHELFKYLKDSNFSLTLNEMGVTRPRYGGVLVKKHEYNGNLDIGVIDWVNVDFDPGDILGGALIQTFHLQPSEFMAQADVWENVDDVMELFAKANKNKPGKIMVKEISGEFPLTFYKESKKDGYKETESDKKTYKRMCFYVAVINKENRFLYCDYEKDNTYKYLPWEKVGLGLGRGVIEEGFQAQIWTNDAMISMKNAAALSSKVLLQTNSQKISGNALVGVDNGHIFQTEKDASLSALNLGPSKLPELEKLVGLWNSQFDRSASTYDANTGEAPTAGTPYSQTALLNQVANSPFEYRREEWGIFLNEILNEWILPFLKKKIMKKHYLTSEFDAEELDLIDESIAHFETNKVVFDRMMNTEQGVSAEEQMNMISNAKQELRKSGKRREIKIPEKYLDVKGKITANITGELKNKGAVLQSLDGVFKSVISTYNPQTGEFNALKDPTLAKIFGMIVEISGIPFSSAELLRSPVKTANTPVPAPALNNGRTPAPIQ